MEWVRFALTAVLLACSVFCFASAVLGVYSFGFILNRIHASGIGDSLGLFCAVLAVMIGSGEAVVILKLCLIVAFMWCTSPVSTHFIAQVEYYMNQKLGKYVEREYYDDAS